MEKCTASKNIASPVRGSLKAIKRLAQLKRFKQIVEERASHTRAIDHRSISDQR
jgi:hypothetical protein